MALGLPACAADACKNGRVAGGVNRKPSFIIKRGDVVSVKKAPITYSSRFSTA